MNPSGQNALRQDAGENFARRAKDLEGKVRELSLTEIADVKPVTVILSLNYQK